MSLIQNLFDKAVTHLLTQGRRSLEYGACSYRGAHGDKCAIGALIDDKVYHPEIEGTVFHPEIEGRAVSYEQVQTLVAESNGFKVEDLTVQDWETLTILQEVHDMFEPIKWEEKLKVVAEQYNLTMPNLDY